MNITQHFTLEEFQRSSVADAHGIDNTIPAQYIPTWSNSVAPSSNPAERSPDNPSSSVPATAAQPSTSR